MDHRMRLVLALLVSLTAPCFNAFIPGADGPVTSQQAVEGGNATFYCDSSPSMINDELMLLVWYKDNSPIYSFDTRSFNEWSNESFNDSGRLGIDRKRQPTALTVTNLRKEDQGLYHCRVDFLLSPTRNLGVNLTIIVLPSQPFFLDEVHNKVESKIGPYHEGDILVLSCLVIGGVPPPHITWYSGDILVDDSDGASEIPGVKENQLFLPLARENAAPLSCRASNTHLTEPLVTTLQVELYVPAQNVSISWIEGVDTHQTLRAGRRALAKCTAYGSHPVSDIAWWLDDKHLVQRNNQTTPDGTDVTISYLELNPSVADNGATLSCVATNIAMAPSRGSKAAITKLNITYSPLVEVSRLGNGKFNEVVKLDTLHLECKVKANPPVDMIEWYFDDEKVMPNGIWGKNTSLASLIVEEATREHAGRYSCAAGNVIGETRSHYINIKVLYPPECTKRGVTLVQETLKCSVDALPPADTYFWHVTPSGLETQQVTTGSPLLPLAQLIGPLAGPIQVVCEAGNGIASQEKPCKKIVSLDHLRPMQPQQCDLAYDAGEFHMRCIPVENATYYEASVWRMSNSNTSLVLERRESMGWGSGGQALAHGGSPWLVRGVLGKLNFGDEAGASACNRYGCSTTLLLRPTDTLLKAASPPWYEFLLEKDVGLSLGVLVLVAVFIISTYIVVKLTRRSRPKTSARVVQVLQLDDVAREYLDAIEHKRHAACSVRSCSARSCSSRYSGESLDSEPPAVDRHRKPLYYWDTGPPPDVTLTLESAV